jgi:hypothetical protein
MSKPFFAVFVKESRHIPGDARSRKCPGYGCPAHTEHYTSVEKFTTKAELQEWVEREERRAFGKREYEVVKCLPMKVTTTLKIDVDIADAPETD